MTRTATNCAPRSCTCGAHLPKPQYGWPWTKPDPVFGRWLDPKAPTGNDKVWFVPCKCGLQHIWSYPNKYVARSIHPLFDTQEETTR